MHEVDIACEILEKMQMHFRKSEDAITSILRILDQMENIEKTMEENHE